MKFFATGLLMLALLSGAWAGPVSGQGAWEHSLEARDLDGDPATVEAWYDRGLGITWLADTMLAASNVFGLPTGERLGAYPSDAAGTYGYIGGDGMMNWAGALYWLDAMNATRYLGYGGWRMPVVGPVDGRRFDRNRSPDGSSDQGFARTTSDGSDGGWRDAFGEPVSEMGHMYYVNLANSGQCDADRPWCVSQRPSGRFNTGPFDNLQRAFYRSGTEAGSEEAWDFSFLSGLQGVSSRNALEYVWVVHDGDIGEPLPEH